MGGRQDEDLLLCALPAANCALGSRVALRTPDAANKNAGEAAGVSMMAWEGGYCAVISLWSAPTAESCESLSESGRVRTGPQAPAAYTR